MKNLKIVSSLNIFLLLCVNFSFYANSTTNLENELLNACKSYDRVTVQKLVKQPGINLNAQDEDGRTALIIASKQGSIEIVDFLLSIKKSDGSFAVNVNQSDNNGMTSLLVACQYRRNLVADELLKVAGIDVNLADNNGNSPLLIACKNNGCNFNIEIICTLLEEGADNRANQEGETPLGVMKNDMLYGTLEGYLKGEIHQSQWNSALSKEACQRMKKEGLEDRLAAKKGIPFHE